MVSRFRRVPAPVDLRYAAFISYSHADKTYREPNVNEGETGFPVWLHRRLEAFRVPDGLRRDYAQQGKILPVRLGRVFRDDDEFGSEKDLATAIKRALGRAESIVVICSPRSAASRYVADEVRTFKHLHGGDNVFAVIIDGKPDDPARECFSDALKYEVGPDGVLTTQPASRNPIAADLQEFDRETVFLKLAAGLLGVDFGRLRDREKQAERLRRARARALFISGVVLVCLALAGAFGVTRLLSGIGERTSLTLAELAKTAADVSDFESAARFARAGLVGADWPLIGFDARAAEAELRRAVIGSRRIALLEGHGDRVDWTAFSPDGARLATHSADGELRFWTTDTGAPLGMVGGATRHIYSAAFSPDGARFVTTEGPEARIWDVATLRPLATLQGRQLPLDDITYSPNGRRIAATLGHQHALVWDAASRREIGWIRPERTRVASLAFSPDGERIATALENGEIRLWSADGARPLRTLASASMPAEVVAYSADGALIAGGWQDGLVRTWSAESGAQQDELRLGGSLRVLVFSPTGRELAAAAANGEVTLINLTNGVAMALEGHEGDVVALAFSPDGAQLISGSVDGTARIWAGRWDERDERPLAILRGHADALGAVAFSPDGARVATGSADHSARLWRAGEGVERTLAHEGDVWAAAFSLEGRQFATASDDGRVRIWNAEGDDAPQSLQMPAGVSAFALSPRGDYLAAGVRPHGTAAEGDLTLWNLETNQPAAQLVGVNDKTAWIAFAPSGDRFAAALGLDPVVRIWGLDGREQASFGEHTYGAAALAFSPDEQRLATAANDGEVRIWNLNTNRVLARFRTEEETASALAFSPDGELLAVAAGFNAGIWDTERGVEIATLRGHSSRLSSIAFSADGARVVTSGHDATARLWDVASGRQIASYRLPTRFALGVSHSFAALSPSGDQLLAGSADGSARLWAVNAMTFARRRELMREACTSVLSGPVSQLTAAELRAAPALDPSLDRDACRPANLWAHLGAALGLWRPQTESGGGAVGAASPTPSFARGPTPEERAAAAEDEGRRQGAELDAELRAHYDACVALQAEPRARISACQAMFGYTASGEVLGAAKAFEAIAYYELGDFDEAVRTADLAFNYDEENVMAYWVRGMALLRQGQSARAADDFSAVIRLAPDHADAYYLRAETHRARGNSQSAIADYDRAIGRDPDNPIYLNAACWTRTLANRDAPLALEQCNASLAVRPGDAGTLDSRGYAHLRQRRYEAALVDFEAALRIDAASNSSLYGRGLARTALGDAVEGRRDMETAGAQDSAATAELRQAGFE
jgi:WD40 repeat protein/tetratricopeptide (TPR) repeat protein